MYMAHEWKTMNDDKEYDLKIFDNLYIIRKVRWDNNLYLNIEMQQSTNKLAAFSFRFINLPQNNLNPSALL